VLLERTIAGECMKEDEILDEFLKKELGKRIKVAGFVDKDTLLHGRFGAFRPKCAGSNPALAAR